MATDLDKLSTQPLIPYVNGAFRHVLDPPGQRAARASNPEEQWYIIDDFPAS